METTSTIQDQAINTVDKMYNDFVTKMLPTVQDGLVITKDYFIDLFGRYVKYLIVTDIISITIALFVAYFAIKWIHKNWKIFKEWSDKQDKLPRFERDADEGAPYVIVITLCSIALIVSFFMVTNNAYDLAKAIFVPEIRIYEELKPLINQTNTNQ
jgi:TRAP-type C4-dicarboxylate transport system permease small subunit